jgi:hypothetical protein
MQSDLNEDAPMKAYDEFQKWHDEQHTLFTDKNNSFISKMDQTNNARVVHEA